MTKLVHLSPIKTSKSGRKSRDKYYRAEISNLFQYNERSIAKSEIQINKTMCPKSCWKSVLGQEQKQSPVAPGSTMSPPLAFCLSRIYIGLAIVCLAIICKVTLRILS